MVLYRDSVSNKFFDSLAAGRPVVANFAGFSTLVAQGAGAGVMLSRDNLDLAADSLVRVINDEEFLKNARRACYILGNESFDRDRLAEMLETVLVQAASRIDSIDCEPIGAEFRDLWHRSRNVSI